MLTYADTLRDVLALRGHETLLTRDSNQVECPVGKRAKLAQAWEADILVSLHMNDFDDDRANGIEVLFSSESSRVIANVVQASLVLVTGLANRGVKMRNDLAVLRFHGVAILIELGFIANDRDRTLLLTSETRWSICREIADRLIAWDRERHKGAA